MDGWLWDTHTFLAPLTDRAWEIMTEGNNVEEPGSLSVWR